MTPALEIVQSVCRRQTLPVPSALFTNNVQVDQLVELLNEVGLDLVNRFTWQVTKRRRTWTSVAGEDQGAIESLFGSNLENIVSLTIWDETNKLPLIGPLSDVQWQEGKAGLGARPLYEYRFENNRFLVLPDMPAGLSLSAIVRTRVWVIAADGVTEKATINATDDSVLLDKELLVLGLRMKWLEVKGLPYAEVMRAFEVRAANLAGKDATGRVLSMSADAFAVRPGIFVPAGSWAP